MPPSTYLARLPGPFSALSQAAEVGGLRLEPLLPVRVRDRYFDTADGALLRSGLAVRVREQDGTVSVGLLALDRAAPGAARDEVAAGPVGDTLDLAGGPLAPAVERAVGTTRLAPLLALRQYRTPRIAYEDGRHVARVSLDVVAYEVPGRPVVTNEVAVDRAPGGTDDDLDRLDDALRGHGLEPVRRTKLERGVLLLPRSPSGPVLLLPDEARRLAALAAGDAVARWAGVVLRAARGLDADAVAEQSGVTPAEAAESVALFQDRRMGAVDALRAGRAEAPVPPRPAMTPPPAVPSPAASSLAALSRLVGADPDGEGPGGGAARDMDDLLDLFQLRETATPLLGDEAGRPAEAAPAPPRTDEGTADAATRPEPVAARDVAAGPTFADATPLLHAAARTVGHYLDRYDDAAGAFAASGSTGDAERLAAAARDVRLALLTFRGVLPDAAVDRLVGGLRPLVVELDAAVDYGRAAAAAGARAGRYEAARRRALAAAGRTLGAGRSAWAARARRLVARLDGQDPVAPADDAAPPPADFVEVGAPPEPSRLGHVLGSAVWARYEAVRAFEGGGTGPGTAEHFASALRALRFALGLSESPGARALADEVGAAEARVAAERDRRRLAGLLGAAPPAPAAVRAEWAGLLAPAFRDRLADVVAGI